MTASPLPPELQDVERMVARMLAETTDRDPDPLLRSRILDSVRDGLRRETLRSRRLFAAAAAATALIVANLSLSAVLVTDCGPRLADGRVSVAETRDRIQELLPTLEAGEALRQARILGLVSETESQLPLVSAPSLLHAQGESAP